ncbi:MAG TPA: hypothetical protein DD381_08410 [Lentisphaeria bacterium]|nr:MAG: hypothetical protein A2X47_11280 [Lentisphaerae bacterium GWF2_38_69]HBM16344.1 hypothetical protein [Lentisphaeria bacterium]
MSLQSPFKVQRFILFVSLSFFLTACSFFTEREQNSFTVAKVSYLGTVWNKGQENASVISQDGGFSFIVPGGSLWYFGDTFLGQRLPDNKYDTKGGLSCSLAFLDKKDFNAPLPPRLKYFTDGTGLAEQAIEYLPNENPDKIRLWPLSGIYLNGKYYCFYSYIEKTGNGTWDFKQTGSGLAESDKPITSYKRVLKNGDFHFPIAPSALVLEGDYLYCYSIGINGRDVYLSRVRPTEIENPEAYYFYSDNGNFTRNNEKTVFLSDIYGQLSIAWNEYLKLYVMAQSSDFFHPREIRFRTSPAPIGPWSEPFASIKVPEQAQNGQVDLIYCSYFHPELFRENGKIMVLTYSIYMKSRWFDINNEMIEFEIIKSAK